MICRKSNTKAADMAMEALKQFPLHIADADLKLTMEAAAIKAKYSLSYADAFAAALTIKRKATLITGDKEFKSLAGETHFKVMFI